MIGAKITPVRGTTEAAQRRIREVSRKIKDTSRANREVSIWLLKWVNDNFKTQGGKVSPGGWEPLKTGGRYKKNSRGKQLGAGRRRQKYDPYAKVLQDTGRLRGSFHNFYTRTTAGVGSALFYAPFHDLGTKYIPQRRILPSQEDRDVEQGALRIYEAHVQRAVR